MICAIRGLEVHSHAVASTPARAGRSPREWVRRGQLQALPGARRARVCGRSVCWGSKGLRPVTSRPQHGKTAARWTRAPGDMSARCLTCIPPDPKSEKQSPGWPKASCQPRSPARNRPADSLVAHKRRSAVSTCATYATPAKTQRRAAFGARISLVHPKHASLAYATRGG